MPESPRGLVTYLAKVALLGVVYYVAARVGLQYASVGQNISLVWPPTGIAFAGVLLLGYRYWPGVALGAFLANAHTSVPLAAAAGIAAGNTLEALIGAALCRRAAGGAHPQLENLRHVRALVLAVPLAALVSAGLGVTTLLTMGVLAPAAVPSAVALWWVGNVLGGLVVAPVFLTWAVRPWVRRGTRGVLEIAVLCLGTVAAAELGLGQVLRPLLGEIDYTYLLFPFVIWAALRFGARGASLMTFTVFVVAIWHTLRGGGPFVAQTPTETLFAIAWYLAVVAVTGLVLAAAVEWEREQASAAIRKSEERVHQAQRLESVGRLAGGVAHETNNQMTVVLGAADFVLRRPDLPDAVRADLEFIRRAAERTAAVTAQLLAFSRRQILKPEVLDLNAVIQGWEPVLRRVMGEDCVVTLRLGYEPGRVKADPGQLEQVLLNLVLNARDAMPRGGHLTVETFTAELTESYAKLKPDVNIRPGPYAVLAVTDTGYGMDPATLGKVFEPFFTTKAVGEGTGLGLSTVYGIVKQSGGYVWAYSELGQGTTFKIYLPIIAEAARPMPAMSAPRHLSPGETILVAEDRADVRAIATRGLRDAGYAVVEAADGREALEMLAGANGRIDLVLTDVVMPGMNGRELAARIAELRPGLPILFMSGYPDGEIARRGLLAPGAVFLQKPFSPEAVARTVRDMLEARHGARVVPAARDA